MNDMRIVTATLVRECLIQTSASSWHAANGSLPVSMQEERKGEAMKGKWVKKRRSVLVGQCCVNMPSNTADRVLQRKEERQTMNDGR